MLRSMSSSVLCLLCQVAVFFAGAARASSLPGIVHISDVAVGKVLKQYASVDVDWWHDSGSGGDWGNASILYLNLQSTRLRNLAKALSPAFLRIGGSQDNIVKYLVGNMTLEECNKPSIFRGAPVTQCLTAKRWREVLQFVDGAGLDLIFGTSFFVGSDGQWDAQNVLDLLQWTAQSGSRFYGLELGEEMEPRSCVKNASTCPLVQGYRRLRQAVRKIWPQQTPLIMGPCDGMSVETRTNPFMATFLQQVLSEGLLDVVVMHSYNNDGGGNWKTPGFLNQTLVQAKDMLGMTQEWSKQGRRARLWCGECGPHNDGGVRNVTDRVMSSFWYLDALGGLARLGLEQHGRQALVGSHYGLLEDFTYRPNPDYFTLVAWKRLMGEIVLDANLSTSPRVDTARVYAHCTANQPGGVTLAFINISPDGGLKLHLAPAGLGRHPTAGRAEMYLFQAPNGDLYSKIVELNGRKLELIGDDLPSMSPMLLDAAKPFDVPPYSYGFVVYPDIEHPACLSTLLV